jgi:hypothetical protein
MKWGKYNQWGPWILQNKIQTNAYNLCFDTQEVGGGFSARIIDVPPMGQ